MGLRLDLASTFDKEALGDPVFRRLYLAGDKAFGWDPADPRLTELAALMADWSGNNRTQGVRRNSRTARLAGMATTGSGLLGFFYGELGRGVSLETIVGDG